MSNSDNFIAIAGNPNSGKTTAFNWYTGARQHVGNYPGITVEKKEGAVDLDGRRVRLVDLPGAYSLSAYSLEEIVARRVLAEDKPGAVLNVLNAGVLERNLYLTVQMLEMGVPVVLALNMMDEARAQGLIIDVGKLEKAMGVTAVPTVARTGEGLKEALAAALALADEKAGKNDALEISYGTDIDEALQRMTPLVAHKGLLAGKFPARWVALKFLEHDEDVMEQCRAVDTEASTALESIVAEVSAHLKATLNGYPEGVIADYRYGYISSVLRQGVVTGADKMRERIAYSDKMDLVLTNRFLGPVILMSLLYVMYYVTFELGTWPADLLGAAFARLGEAMDAALPDGLLKSMLIAGIIDGVGGVFGFVPLIVIMFLFIAFLEDSGYMARVAYMSDRIFRFFGLHGASVMPYIISGGIAGGCAVPGVLATRTLRSPRERLATMLTAPMMTCGAKLPVFLLLVGVFFAEHQALVMFLLTLTGWIAALLTARLLRSTVIRGESTPFVMELPPYRLPTLAGMLIHTWERAWQYIKKAGTIILAISILIWAGMTFPLADKNERPEDALRRSYAGQIGTALEGLSAPAGFDWRTNIALVAGIAAKEVVVATLGTAYSLGSEDAKGARIAENAENATAETLGDAKDTSLARRIRKDKNWSPATALSLLLFTLLYSPCFVTLAVIKQESGEWKWLFFSFFFNLVLAWGVSVATYQMAVRLL